MKKLCALLVSLAMLAALAVPAVAVEQPLLIAPAPVSAQTVGIVLNGKAVAFPDAAPVMENGCVLAPFSALAAALGATWSVREDGAAECVLEGVTLTARSGEKALLRVTEAGTETLQMPAPCTEREGQLYLPVRSVAEALGFDVLWDGASRSAVLVDPEALIAQIDQSFTVLNAAWSKLQQSAGRNYKSSATYDITVDVPDQGFGEYHVVLKMKLDMVSSATAVEMSGSMDASSLAKALDLDGAVEDGTVSTLAAAALRKALSNITFQLRMDLETGAYYFNMPLLATLSGGAIAANAWLKLSLDSLGLEGMGDMAAFLQEHYSMGGILYTYCRLLAEQFPESFPPAALYGKALEAGQLTAVFLGDAKARQSGAGHTFHFGKAELKELISTLAQAVGETVTAADLAEVDALFESFAIDLTVRGDGSMTCTFDVQLAKSEDLPAGMTPGLKGTMTSDADHARLNMTLDLGSLGKMQYVLAMTMSPTGQKPKTEPPAGAEIVDLSELFRPMPALYGPVGPIAAGI